MREILFRGKTDSGDWIYGYYVLANDISQIFVPFPQEDKEFFKNSEYEKIGGRYKDVISETVGQYTGMEDKNGKKIFEGDIIYRDWFGGLTYQVVYDDLYASFFGETTKGDFTTFNGDGGSFVIIGNIHDNPELMSN